MPLMTRRSSVLRAPGWFFGRSGSITAHCGSLNQNSFAMTQPRFDNQRLNHRPA
jgi:hypothetical protein